MKKKAEDFAVLGGCPIFDSVKTTMNLPRPDKSQFLRSLKSSFDLGEVTNCGPQVKLLEKSLAEFHEVEHCVTFCSCFSAMSITLRTLALAGKTEVVVPSLTYRRMSDIIIWAGLVPRFCDVNEETLGVTPEEAESCINENTAIILAPHPISNLCDIEGMQALAKKYELPILFDAVEANGGTFKNRKIGSFGNAESFSMHPSKIINGAEGGYITTNDVDLAAALRIYRNNGINEFGEVVSAGSNARLNEMHAALALSSLTTIETLMVTNRQHHLEYQKYIDDIDGLRVVKYPNNEKRNWKSVLVELQDSWPLSRKQTLNILNEEKIWARAYYSPAQHKTTRQQVISDYQTFSITNLAVKKYMLLPFGYTVSLSDIKEICATLNAIKKIGSTVIDRMPAEPV